ncbi:MAG: hypothetical protein WA971_15095, partial [Microbacterium sp.]
MSRVLSRRDAAQQAMNGETRPQGQERNAGRIAAVSVVVPHYGDPAPALALIAQLRAQAGAPALQLIVSDDCSPQP